MNTLQTVLTAAAAVILCNGAAMLILRPRLPRASRIRVTLATGENIPRTTQAATPQTVPGEEEPVPVPHP